MSETDTKSLIETAVNRFLEEVPALQKLKLVAGLELRGRGDTQMYRVEMPGPKVTKDIAADAKVDARAVQRAQFNELATKGHVADWREAFAHGEAKATGIDQVLKLIVNVVERQEERSRTRRATAVSASFSAALSCSSISARPESQKPGIGQVDADDRAQLLGAARAAGRKQLQVARDERLALCGEAAVRRQRQQLAIGVGVDVAGRVDEVGDVGPPDPVAVGDLHRVAEQLGLAVEPELADPVGGQLALVAAAGVHQVLEAVHRHLPEHGRHRAVQPLGQQAQPQVVAVGLSASSRSNTSVSPNTEAVSASVSGVL